MNLRLIFAFGTQSLTMYSLYVLLLLLGPHILFALIKEITFTPVTRDSPWSPRIRAHWDLVPDPYLGDSPIPLFYGGWPHVEYCWSLGLALRLPLCADYTEAWLHTPDHSWIPYPVDQCWQLYVECSDSQDRWPRGQILLPPGASSVDLHWLAWQTLITRRLDPWEHTICLSRGQAEYDLQPCTHIDDFTPTPSTSIGHRWTLNMSVPRYGAVTGVHYNNTHLNGDTIYYVLGGGIPQPDNGDYDLKDLWASRDGGRTWIRVMEGWWLESTDQISLGISPAGVMVVSITRSEDEDLEVSFDGGASWDTCRVQTSLGQRHGATLGFDAEGYLYVMGGLRDNRSIAEVLKSEISFNKMEEVRECCGHLQLPAEGIPGLEEWWKDQPENQRAAPHMY